MGLAQLLSQALLLAHVTNGAGHERPPLALHRREARFDGELGPVLAEPIELPALSHRAGVRIGGVAGAVAGMLAAEALGDQDLHGATQELVALVAEHPLHLSVDEDDLPLVVDDDHGVGRGLEQVTKLLLALAQRLRDPLRFREVARDHRESDGLAGGVVPEGERDMGGEPGAVAPDARELAFPLAVATRGVEDLLGVTRLDVLRGVEDEGVGATHDLSRLVAVDPPRALVPRDDRPLKILGDDRVLGGRLEDGVEEGDLLALAQECPLAGTVVRVAHGVSLLRRPRRAACQ